jgi:transcriptional regulator with XRE-family HTH domain
METKRKQKDVAVALGISVYTLSRYLAGKSRAKGIREAQRLVGAAYAIGSKTVAEDWLFPRSETLRKALGV